MIAALDRYLNRFSMYTVVSISLTILYVFALTFSLLGWIAYSPLELLASTAVLGATVWIASRLFGLLFAVRVHDESSFITALILSFIMTPTIEVSGLLALAIVGLLAGASKFLLAWKGRHIFNPAASGAVLAGLFGIAYASWWVATPVLAIPTAIGAFMILYKTRRLVLAGIFLAVATVLLFIVFAVYGLSLLDSAALLLSWPILFLAGFMLSEPLTLPRRRWQSYVEAVFVGILVAVPLSVGSYEMTPALALLIGNAYAFLVSHRHRIQLTYRSRRKLTPTSYEITFEPPKPVSYKAGQYVELTLFHPRKDFRGFRRSFSITSAEGAKKLTLGIKFYEPSSTYKKALKALEAGTVLNATSVNGDFVLPGDPSRQLLFVAGGIGITPYISHIRTLAARDEARDIVLIYAVSSVEELAYADELKEAGIRVIVVTKDAAALPVRQWQKVSTSFIDDETIALIDDIAARDAYISGPPGLVRASKQLLHSHGVRHIKTDYFTGY